MIPQELIRKKRDGGSLSADDIQDFIAGMTSGAVTDAQTAAFAMAVFFNGMARDERVALTRAMTHSGTVLAWDDFPGPLLDKHSTGGIGDTVSLILAPAIAACGGYVPMISGRGLGHTGGTLDKLDSIPGYRSQPDLALFRKAVKETGAAIIGQTSDLAPADRKLYAIRDVTATVESIPLITASILSKKLAAGLSGLAMDVKTGSGAFMSTLEGARDLARSIADVATAAGLPTTALITDMDEPLADAAGNAVEVKLAINHLTGTRINQRLHDVTIALGIEMLITGRLASHPEEARAKLEHAFSSGTAAEHFAKMVTVLGGPTDLLEKPDHYLPQAHVVKPVLAETDGYVTRISTRDLGVAIIGLGGGRTRAGDTIDHAVGLTALAAVGDLRKRGEPLAYIHAQNENDFTKAEQAIKYSYSLSEKRPQKSPLILERITPDHA
jgi:thymidine phosphorylase